MIKRELWTTSGRHRRNEEQQKENCQGLQGNVPKIKAQERLVEHKRGL